MDVRLIARIFGFADHVDRRHLVPGISIEFQDISSFNDGAM